MSLGTLGWGLVSLAKELREKARREGVERLRLDGDQQRESYSGAGLVSVLGRGLDPQIQLVDHGTGQGRDQETECGRVKLKGIGLKGLC